MNYKVMKLCLINQAICHEGVWGSACIGPRFLISVLVGSEWSASRPRQLYPPVPIGYEDGWALQPVWTICKSQHAWPYRDSNSDPTVVQPVASHFTDCTTAALWLSLGVWRIQGRLLLVLRSWVSNVTLKHFICCVGFRYSKILQSSEVFSPLRCNSTSLVKVNWGCFMIHAGFLLGPC
jgi:hypothetical protein